MGKGEDTKFLKIQTCVLKVNLCCHGCQKKVKKALSKIDGVYTTRIDVEERKVTVTGDVDPAILIKKLSKAGKRAELWPAKSAAKDQNLINQLQKLRLEHSKEPLKGNEKPQKGGGGGKDDKGHQPQQAKGLKDLNFPTLKDLKIPVPNKESKTGKADHLPMEETDEGSDDDELDEFEDDEKEFDDMDESDAESYDSLPTMAKPVNFQPRGDGEAKDKKEGGKGGEAQLENKSEGGKKAGGGKKEEGKNGHGIHDNKSGGGNHAHHNANPSNKDGGGGGLAMGQPPHMMGQLSNMQGLPPGGGYIHGGGTVPPEMMAAAPNPYQQQYLQALQQQRMMMMNNQPMGYGYGQPAYMMPQPHSYTVFSEENPNSCSIM